MINEEGNTTNYNDNNTKKKYITVISKIIVIFAILGIALYLIYTESKDKRALFYLSDHEIIDVENTVPLTNFSLKKKIYYMIRHTDKSVNADSVSIEIERFVGNEYNHYKQITFEIEKQFPYLNGYISDVFFSKEGKYRIKLYLDNNLIKSNEIQVNKE